ncbi:MAG: hypothetical protein AAGA77_25690 [Bacteroidota bacterium]
MSCRNNEPREYWHVQSIKRFDHFANVRPGRTIFNNVEITGLFADAILTKAHPNDMACEGELIKGIFITSATSKGVLVPEPPLDGDDGADIKKANEKGAILIQEALEKIK